jgi:hypothetical protein
VVRGLAALLGGVAYFLVARALPDAGAYVPAVCGAVAMALCALAPLPGRDDPIALTILGGGAALLAVALNGADVVAQATPAEALFAACAGLLFGFGFAIPAAVVALPLLVAGIDGASLLAGGEGLGRSASGSTDVLTLTLPAWGQGGDAVPALGLLDATFLALFAGWALRYDLRPRVAIALMTAGLAVALVLALALGRSIPTLPFLAAGFLLPSVRRIPHLLRSEG